MADENTLFNNDQQSWISGFFAGINSRLLKQAGGQDTSNSVIDLTVAYGTQTGNSEAVAEDVVAAAAEFGMSAKAVDIGDLSLDDLSTIERLFIICSTYGEGEMPDNAEILWQEINEAEGLNISQLNFSVLSLGDSSYDQFCEAGKNWDAKLADLGANCVAERVDCDLDFDDDAEAWFQAALPVIKETGNTPLSAETSSGTASTAKEKSKYNRKNPFAADLLINKVLTSANSSKEIRHFEICLKGSGLHYEAGDALNVMPQNNPELVDDLLSKLGLSADAVVGNENLRDALINTYDIKVPSTGFLQEVAKQSGDEELTRLLENNDKEALNSYLWGRDIIDFIIDLKPTFTAEAFLEQLRKLQARAYSISSSSKKQPDDVHLTISSVRYESQGRKHEGVASCYLAERVNDDEKVLVYFSPNNAFRVPEDSDTPIIMVGPGTGIAPFRAFLQEREASNAKGDNWLFFGDRTQKDDFIYQDEIEAWEKSGLLTNLDLAFSRDQEQKIYVQTRMKEKGAELYEWLERGGYFYICGDATYMAKDVDKTLHTLIQEHGKMTEAEAEAYVNNLKKSKRYVRDVY